MEKWDIRALKQSASEALQQADFSPRRLVLLHSAIAVAAALLINLLNLLLTHQINGMTTLSSLSSRSTLSALQYSLSLVFTLLVPLWDAGYTAGAMQLSRRKPARYQILLDGFRNWKKFVTCGLLLMLQAFALSYFSFLLASLLVSLLSSGLMLTGTDPNAQQLSMIIVGFICAGATMVYLFYRYRLLYYVILDYPHTPAMRILWGASRMMRGRKLQFLRLDVSFWWYFIALFLINGIPYGDSLLERAGYRPPISPTLLSVLLYLLYASCIFGLYIWKKNHVSVTYATAYNAVLQEEASMGQAPTMPQRTPQGQ